MKKRMILFILFLISLSAFGCATPMITKISSDPPGANVFIGGKLIGTTPLGYDLSSVGGQPSLKFQLEGYQGNSRVIQKRKDSFGFATQWPREVSVFLEKKE